MRLIYLDIIFKPRIAPRKKIKRILKLFKKISELNLKIKLWRSFKLLIINGYTPNIKSKYDPEIPGSIIAVIAIKPEMKI